MTLGQSITIESGAGCHAVLTWPGDGTVAVTVKNADGKRLRRYHGPWTRERIRASSSSELRHIAFLAVRTGRCPPFCELGFSKLGDIATELGLPSPGDKGGRRG